MKKFHLFNILMVFSTFILAQDALNVVLLNQQLTPGATRYSGSWIYADENGNEYALLGANIGLVAFDMDNNFEQVGFIPGPVSNWREIMVIGDYAYVVTEGSGVGQGMQIIDLSYLPDSLHLASTYTDAFTRAHIIQKDLYNPDRPFLYVNGITPGSQTLFLDVTDPVNPVIAGEYGPYYIHDCHVRGDTLYASAIFEGVTDIVDISDKANPVLLQQISFPGAFPHSSFTSQDNAYLFATDEIDGLPMKTFRINEFDNITEVDEYTADPVTLVHNPYGRGDFLFIAHNSAGLRVLDVAKPQVPVEVGYYDTYSGGSGGSTGLWSACPYSPSGRIIGGDRQSGLFVWEFNNTLAGRIYGEVLDSLTQEPIFGADISFDPTENSTTSDFVGGYKFGNIPGNYSLTCSADGYNTKTVDNISLSGGDSLFVRFELSMPMAVSVESDFADRLVEVFPNPITDTWFINNETIFDNLSVHIFTSSGKLVDKQEVKTGETRIDTSGFPSGMLIFKIINGDGHSIKVGKVFKQ